MKEWWLALPLVIPMLGAGVDLLFIGKPLAQKAAAVFAAAGHLAVSVRLGYWVHNRGPLEVQVGGWPAPFGVTLFADRAGVLALALSGLITLATTLYAISSTKLRKSRERDYFPLFPILLMGASGAALSSDLFNLYVWFEVMLAGSFALLAFGGKAGSLKASLLYVSLNLLGSAFYLFAVAALYSAFGTLDLGDLAMQINVEKSFGLRGLAWCFLFVFFLIKMAAFPFFAWLPTSYPQPPIAVTALFSGILTKLAFFVLLRLWNALAPPQIFTDLAYWIGVLTLVSGLSAALVEREARRLAMWLLAGEMGYLMLALSFWERDGVAASLYLLLHMSIGMNALLLVIGLLERKYGTLDTRRCYGIMSTHPILSLSLGIGALALAGVPPLSGFIAKIALLQTAVERSAWLGVGAVLVGGFFALGILGWLWLRVSWGEPAEEKGEEASGGGSFVKLTGPSLVIATLVLLAVAGGWTYDYCLAAADEILRGP